MRPPRRTHRRAARERAQSICRADPNADADLDLLLAMARAHRADEEVTVGEAPADPVAAAATPESLPVEDPGPGADDLWWFRAGGHHADANDEHDGEVEPGREPGDRARRLYVVKPPPEVWPPEAVREMVAEAGLVATDVPSHPQDDAVGPEVGEGVDVDDLDVPATPPPPPPDADDLEPEDPPPWWSDDDEDVPA